MVAWAECVETGGILVDLSMKNDVGCIADVLLPTLGTWSDRPDHSCLVL